MRGRAIIGWLALFFCASVSAQAAGQNLLSAPQWREDLRYLVEQISVVHPDAFHHVSEPAFRAAAAKLDAAIPTLSDHQIEVELVRLIAMLGEGHSRLSLPGLSDPMSDVPEATPVKDPRLAFHALPLRLYEFTDGLFVVAATAQWRSLLGAQVLAIGGHPAEAAQQAVQPLVNRDNEMGQRLIAPQLVVIPEILQALQLVDDPSKLNLVLRAPDGAEITRELAPLALGAPPAWLDRVAPPPLYLQHPEENLRAERLREKQILYIKVNILENSAHRTVAQFARDFDGLAAAHPADRLVIDFRGCHGGDNQQFRSLLLAVIRNRRLDRLGNLFVIADRASFSAAVNAVSDLERLTNSILVGEPGAGAPSSWGDPKRITLPNSGLIARIATVYWRDWTPGGKRPWISPDIPTALASGDYFAGRDPALEIITQFPRVSRFEPVLKTLLARGAGRSTIERLYYQRKTDPLSASESTEEPMQRIGAQLVASGSYDNALLVFAINQSEYPESIHGALETVQVASASHPGDTGLASLRRALERLQQQH